MSHINAYTVCGSMFVCVCLCAHVCSHMWTMYTHGHIYNRSGDMADTHNLLPQSVP